MDWLLLYQIKDNSTYILWIDPNLIASLLMHAFYFSSPSAQRRIYCSRYCKFELELVKVITQGFLFCLYKCIQPCGRAYVSPNLHDVIKEMWKSVFHNNVFEVFTASVVACTSHQCRVAPLFSVQCSSGITHYRAILYLQGFSYNIKDKDLYKKAKINYANYM